MIEGFYFIHVCLRPFHDYFSSYETDQSVGGRKRENSESEKPPGTPASRTWFVSHVARAELKYIPVTAVVKKPLCHGGHIFATKNNSLFVILPFEILTNR